MEQKRPQPQVQEADEIEEVLAGQSLRAFEQWLDSPFWRALTLMLKEQIARNREDVVAGDIAIKAAQTPGLVYRTNEALRGGIVAMQEMLTTMPQVLHDEVEAAMHKTKEERHVAGS